LLFFAEFLQCTLCLHVNAGLLVTASAVEEIQNKVARLETSDQLKQRQIENLSLQLQKASQTTRTEAAVGKVMLLLKWKVTFASGKLFVQ
jgi:hypothetical protein